MSDVRALVRQSYLDHSAVHGPDCGRVPGAASSQDACAQLRRAFVRAFPEEAQREDERRWYHTNPVRHARNAKRREYYRAYNREYHARHREEIHERQRRYYLNRKAARVTADKPS